MRRLIALVTFAALASAASACPVKAGTFAAGTLPRVPTGLKAECGLMYRMLKSGMAEDLGGGWFELYSSPKVADLAGIEKTLTQKGYISMSNMNEAKDAIAELSNEMKGMIGKDAKTNGKFLVNAAGNKALLLMQLSIPNDNLLLVISMPTE